jgi:drug/metabolite transporter (DMT)-like permease
MGIKIYDNRYNGRLKAYMASAVFSQADLFRAAMFLFSGVFIFSIQDVIIKWISRGYPVHEIVLIRSISGLVPLLLIAHFSGGIKLLRTRRYGAHAARSLLMFTSYTTFYMSLAALPLAESVTLFFSAPLFITVLSVFLLDEHVDMRCWVGVAAGLMGVVMMLKPNVNNINPAGLLAIVSAFCYALGSVITRKMGATESGIALAFYPTVMYIAYAAVFGVLFNMFSFAPSSHPSLNFLFHEWRIPLCADFCWMVLLGLMVAMGFYCLSQAYRSIHPAVIAPLEYIAVPLSAFWGYIVWHETLDLQSVSAIVVIIGSGLYILGRETIVGARTFLNIFKIRLRR